MRYKFLAGQALAVDREKFAEEVTKRLEQFANIEVIRQEVGKEISVKQLAENGIVIIATGPLTSESLSKEIQEFTGEDKLYFYDAAAPIVEKNSINMNIGFYGDRYKQERGKEESIDEWRTRLEKENENSYINLPMNKEEYEKFYGELINAEVVELHNFEKKKYLKGVCL